jgi:hypothetical protein
MFRGRRHRLSLACAISFILFDVRVAQWLPSAAGGDVLVSAVVRIGGSIAPAAG